MAGQGSGRLQQPALPSPAIAYFSQTTDNTMYRSISIHQILQKQHHLVAPLALGKNAQHSSMLDFVYKKANVTLVLLPLSV